MVLFERLPQFTTIANGLDVESRLGCVTTIEFDCPEPSFTTQNNSRVWPMG